MRNADSINKPLATLLMSLGLIAAGCGEAEVVSFEAPTGAVGSKGSKSDSSADAVFLDFEWDGELIANSCFNPNSTIESQVLWTVGQLNGNNSVGRTDRLEITNIETGSDSDGGCRVTYHAKMPVAWGELHNVPTSYTLTLPLDMRTSGVDRFVEQYNPQCSDFGAHDVTAGIMWYYFRPARSGCTLADEDLATMEATVFDSPIGTTGKYPEYHEIWKDDVFEIVAIFGKYKDDATTSSDAGIGAWNQFVRDVQQFMGPMGLTMEPANIPHNAGVENPEISFEASLPDGKRIVMRAFLVDSVGSADSTFWAKYEALTPSADFIVYNGHAGLGSNIRKLASKGVWKTGQYAIVFMNGCDTYAYVDSALADAHAAVNDDDDEGTKYLDIVANAMPSFFRSMPAATMALVRALTDFENPRTYEQILDKIDAHEVALVSGEHDNVYFPGFGDDTTPEPPAQDWKGFDEQGTVAKDEAMHFASPVLPAGRYEVALDGTGDADLYVRIGEAPGTELFDCRPFDAGSAEICSVDLQSDAPIHVMVVGWAASSDFKLTGTRLQ